MFSAAVIMKRFEQISDEDLMYFLFSRIREYCR
jgi:hypothetical protein